MTCPPRQHAEANGETSARRGVVSARRHRRPRPHPRPVPPRTALVTVLSTLVALAALAGGAFWLATRPAEITPEPALVQGDAPALASAEGLAPPAPAAEAPLVPVPPPAPSGGGAEAGGGIDPGDVEWANRLGQRLERRQPVSRQDLQRVEDLRRWSPTQKALDSLLVGTLLSLAGAEQQARRFEEAERLLLQATTVEPDHPAPWIQLVTLRHADGDWSGTEQAARRLLQIRPDDTEALYALGFALFRQDRGREGLAPLRQALRIRDHTGARALIARIEKGQSDEAGFRNQRLAHFNVRYDGSAHEGVGRAVLRALERHYATLVTTLDHQPTATIPVILFTREGYYDASGAPAWSGGVYDQIDGRIRIPVGGLTESLTPDMDDTLIHEVTHAFVHSMSAGAASRVIHEGLAQYMEGKRVDRLLKREQRRVLAQGRAGGVAGFYIESLGYVEFLLNQRGMGGMQDLLEAMAETGSLDRAFQKVYGRSAGRLEEDWRNWMKRRYGR